MGENYFLEKKKTKMTKKLNFENTKTPEIFHFPIFFWGGGTSKTSIFILPWLHEFLSVFDAYTLTISEIGSVFRICSKI